MNPPMKGTMSQKHGYDAESIIEAVNNKVDCMDISSLIESQIDKEVDFYLEQATEEALRDLMSSFGPFGVIRDHKRGTSSASEIATPKPFGCI